MDGNIVFTDRLGVSDVYAAHIGRWHDFVLRRNTVKILVVIDGGISLTEGPSAFGVGRVVRLLRETRLGCTRFEVDTARRDGSTAGAPTYTNFRFDQEAGGEPVLNRYHEVWCFGFNPDNFALGDDRITLPSALPTSDSELRVLTEWMNTRRGGVLAMGDHDYLGASMCHRIPRVRSMRRWTNAQGVPPIGGAMDADTHLRHDTNQPATPGQQTAGHLIPFLNQEDSVPQSIDWVPWMSHRHVLYTHSRPHPILCHPSHGPIDVMPDHPHEGWCYEDHEIDLTDTYSFDGLNGNEYPTSGGGMQPAPTVIAHGTTTPNPPYNLAKGPSPEKRFAMVSVYDGRPANVGRVVVDSTWHHWFDENIQAIEAAGGENWDKISRYFLNVADWLAPPTIDWCLVATTVASHFTYLGFQEWHPRAHVFDLGRSLHAHLAHHHGPCWISEWTFDRLRWVDEDLWAWMFERIFDGRGPRPGGDPCLSCPPFELIEIAALGGVVKATMPIAERVRAQVLEGGKDELDLDLDELREVELEGVKVGLAEFRTAMRASIEEIAPLLGAGERKAAD